MVVGITAREQLAERQPTLTLIWVFSAHAAVASVVSWSRRWVYLVRPALPKFFTCITLGRTDLSK